MMMKKKNKVIEFLDSIVVRKFGSFWEGLFFWVAAFGVVGFCATWFGPKVFTFVGSIFMVLGIYALVRTLMKENK